MGGLLLLRIAYLAGALLLLIAAVHPIGSWRPPPGLARLALTLTALGSLALLGLVVVNHLDFPLNHVLLETSILQTVERASRLEVLYPAPSQEYSALPYNPLYYLLCVPFVRIAGAELSTLRLVSVIAMLGSLALVYGTVAGATRSRGWGLTAVGLFAAAYRVMDAHLDSAQPDAWLLLCALLGTALIARERAPLANVCGVTVLVASFWFKQHGALFALCGVLFLTWRDGPRRALPHWIVAALLGPGLYGFAGPALLGDHFHYHTWTVPSRWSELEVATVTRYLGFILGSYPFLAIAVLAAAGADARRRLGAWHAGLLASFLIGAMTSLDPGSSDNGYIPLGAFLIVVGTSALPGLLARSGRWRPYRPDLALAFASYTLLLYNPLYVLKPPETRARYEELLAIVRGLGAPVYAPDLGPVPGEPSFHPSIHWVTVEDAVRGPGRDRDGHPEARRLIADVIRPRGTAYLLAGGRVENYPAIGFLQDYYVLERDYGERFRSLGTLPSRFAPSFPRRLYRWAPEEARAARD